MSCWFFLLRSVRISRGSLRGVGSRLPTLDEFFRDKDHDRHRGQREQKDDQSVGCTGVLQFVHQHQRDDGDDEKRQWYRNFCAVFFDQRHRGDGEHRKYEHERNGYRDGQTFDPIRKTTRRSASLRIVPVDRYERLGDCMKSQRHLPFDSWSRFVVSIGARKTWGRFIASAPSGAPVNV